MGRKTKKEKILADLRRRLAQADKQTEASTVFVPQNHQPILSKSILSREPVTPIQSSSIYIYPSQVIKQDLTKTVILSILAISFEVALFYYFEGKIRLPIINFSLPISLNIG